MTGNEMALMASIAVDMQNKEVNEVLDKIRAEIKKLDYLSIADGSDGYDKYIDQQDVLQIIDKYRAESEEV